MTPEEESWAEALAIERFHGDQAPLHAANQIGVRAVLGDTEGVACWKLIAVKLDALRSGRRQS